MNMRETLILKTLAFKELNQGAGKGDFLDALLDQNPEVRENVTRNICAHIPKDLYTEVETMGQMLGLNKREIITLALNDFMVKAHETMAEFNAFPAEGGV